MKMLRRSSDTNSNPTPTPLARSSSCEEFLLLKRDSHSSVGNPTASFKSTDDLPASVAECFQDSSLLGRIQNSLLLLIGRGSRYKLRSTKGCSLLSIISQKKKQEEKDSLGLSASSNDSNSSATPLSTRKQPVKQVNSLPTRCKVSSQNTYKEGKRGSREDKTDEASLDPAEDGSKYSFTGMEDSQFSFGVEEALLRQYMSLQQLAIARRHCNQLRLIRDSLVGRTRPQVKVIMPMQEQEKLRNFLLDVGFVQYYVLLNRHGYDFMTASHMDVLDLAAVGISEPLHRMALKYELDQVRCPITPLQSIPETISEWLHSMSLSEYIEHFQQNGIFCPLAAVGLTKRDLQFMGIYMLGHRKKLILALTAVKLSMGIQSKQRDKIS